MKKVFSTFANLVLKIILTGVVQQHPLCYIREWLENIPSIQYFISLWKFLSTDVLPNLHASA